VTLTSVGACSRIQRLGEITEQVWFLWREPLLADLGTLDLRGIHWVTVGARAGRVRGPRSTIRSITCATRSATAKIQIRSTGSRRVEVALSTDEHLFTLHTWSIVPIALTMEVPMCKFSKTCRGPMQLLVCLMLVVLAPLAQANVLSNGETAAPDLLTLSSSSTLVGDTSTRVVRQRGLSPFRRTSIVIRITASAPTVWTSCTSSPL